MFETALEQASSDNPMLPMDISAAIPMLRVWKEKMDKKKVEPMSFIAIRDDDLVTNNLLSGDVPFPHFVSSRGAEMGRRQKSEKTKITASAGKRRKTACAGRRKS